MNINGFTSTTDAIEMAILPLLDNAAEYNIDAIAAEVIIDHGATDEDKNVREYRYTVIEGDEFWAAVERHAK